MILRYKSHVCPVPTHLLFCPLCIFQNVALLHGFVGLCSESPLLFVSSPHLASWNLENVEVLTNVHCRGFVRCVSSFETFFLMTFFGSQN